SLLRSLIAAVIPQKHNVAKARKLEAASRGFEDFLEGLLRHGDRPGKPHVFGRRINSAFWHVGDDRGYQRVAKAGAIFSDSKCTRRLCLPSAMCGPFCSVPRIGTMIVVLPDLTRSRSSVHVNSSRNTVSPAWARALGCARNSGPIRNKTLQIVRRLSSPIFPARLRRGSADRS